jgi:hypothetical protein
MTQAALGLDGSLPQTPYALHTAEVAQERQRTDAAMWRILARLQQGPATGPELNAICYRYTGRMSDLRLHHGYTITKEHVTGGVWRYTLIGEPHD